MEFEISNIGVVAAIAAGAISFLSPCVLPLVPGYVSFIAGNSTRAERSDPDNKMSVAWLSICFILGFSTVFVVLGAGATALGQSLRAYSYEAGIIGGVIGDEVGYRIASKRLAEDWAEWVHTRETTDKTTETSAESVKS